MTETKQVTIGSATFNVAQAPAIDQKTLLLLIGAKIALHSASGKVNEINAEMLFGTLLSMPEETFDRIANIVLRKVVIHGQTRTVELQDFQGDMVGYFKLVAEAIKVNLQDFFTYLDERNAANRSATNLPVKV